MRPFDRPHAITFTLRPSLAFEKHKDLMRGWLIDDEEVSNEIELLAADVGSRLFSSVASSSSSSACVLDV